MNGIAKKNYFWSHASLAAFMVLALLALYLVLALIGWLSVGCRCQCS
jgi:cytochrome b